MRREGIGLGDLVLYLVVWLAKCLPEIVIFEMNASLKWRLNQSLSQVLVSKKEKPTVRVYTTIDSVHWLRSLV